MGAVVDSGFERWYFYFRREGKCEISFFEDGNISGRHYCGSLNPSSKNMTPPEMQFRALNDTYAVGLCQACGYRIVFRYSKTMSPREVLNELRALEQANLFGRW